MKLPTLLLTILANCHFTVCDDHINKLFDKINNNFVKLNSIAAKITWDSSIKPENSLLASTANYQKKWVAWQQTTCEQLAALQKRQLLNETQRRQTYLLCRGPQFSYRDARVLTSLYDELQTLYSNNNICIPTQRNVSKENTQEIESAILNYLSTVNQMLKIQNGASFASKMAAKSDLIDGLRLNGEEDFEKLMKKLKNEEVLKWMWLVWREKTGQMKEPFRQLVDLENIGAWRKGYSNIGSSWRDELEIPNLKQKCRQLYDEIRPLYTLLHGVVRFYLRKQYGDIVPREGAIPAHLLGNLWSQNWETMINLITPKKIELDVNIKKLNWTVHHMVKRVEDFYQSLGLPAMTDTFWRESVFENKNGGTRCHGTAADMFANGDFRLLYCSGTSMEDFYVLHHEFGHIHYYKAYEHQPGIFRQANAALHESIGDAIMYGVMTPQHLHRLGLVNDSILYVNSSNNFNKRSVTTHKTVNESTITDDGLPKMKDDVDFDERIEHKTKHYTNSKDGISQKSGSQRTNENILEGNGLETKDDQFFDEMEQCKTNDNIKLVETKKYDDRNNFETDDFDIENDLTSDELLLLRQALNKIPQIPFGLVIEEYRWKYFEGAIDRNSLNKAFWDLTLELQGIAPPEERSEEYFDVGAKYHVPYNTPYSRYFLSSFLQHQIFEALCRAAVFGRRDVSHRIPDSISLNRCDIYGSKAAGKLLKDLMSRGHSQHWQEILQSTTGNTDITSSALKRYYRPLYDVLARIVRKNNIPLGW